MNFKISLYNPKDWWCCDYFELFIKPCQANITTPFVAKYTSHMTHTKQMFYGIYINVFTPEQHGGHFSEGILNEFSWVQNIMKFVPKGPMDNQSTVVKVLV